MDPTVFFNAGSNGAIAKVIGESHKGEIANFPITCISFLFLLHLIPRIKPQCQEIQYHVSELRSIGVQITRIINFRSCASTDGRLCMFEEKNVDKQNAIDGKYYVLTMDLQAVKLAPMTKAGAFSYKTELCSHNFTVYNVATHHCTNFWWNGHKPI